MTLRIISHVNMTGLQERIEALEGIEYRYLDPEEEVPKGLRADVLVTTAVHGKQTKVLMAPDFGIGWVHVFGTGMDGFDIVAVGARDLTCSRGATATPIAEWVLAMMLACVKQLPERWCSAPPEHWRHAVLQNLSGQTLSLVGLGSIGQAVALRALPFGMRVKALVRRPRSSPIAGVELVSSLEALLADADHVVLAAPATPYTYHLLNEQSLTWVKPGAHLVNVARASLIDEHALHAALEDGRLARASLDVADPEPLPAKHWFYHHPRVYFSPHVSWSGPEVYEQMIQRLITNLQHRLRNEPLQYQVDKKAGY